MSDVKRTMDTRLAAEVLAEIKFPEYLTENVQAAYYAAALSVVGL
jgi:hypothetical protein